MWQKNLCPCIKHFNERLVKQHTDEASQRALMELASENFALKQRLMQATQEMQRLQVL